MDITADGMIITVALYIITGQVGKSTPVIPIPTTIDRNTEGKDIAVRRDSMKRLKAKEAELQKSINNGHQALPGLRRHLQPDHLPLRPIRNLFG
jgi:hypothetical protein